MTQYCYEGMFLLDSNQYASSPDTVQGSVMTILERCGAQVVATRPWQDGKLAYPIDKHRKGLYYLTCFKMDGSQEPELRRLCSLNDTVLRELVIRHKPVIFDAMVEALTSRDGALHSPEQKDRRDSDDLGGERGDRGDRPERSDRPERNDRGGDR